MIEYVDAKALLFKSKKSPHWFDTDYTMNIYRGCSHGCVYCDSRSECYGDPDFDRVKVKRDALRILRDDLRRKVRRGVIGQGAMSDPYNPLEREQMLTRNALELINAYGFGTDITTKSDLIVRDIDILSDINRDMPVVPKLTITTKHDELLSLLEPGAPVSSARFDAVRRLSDAGLYTGVLIMPVLPYITDSREDIISLLKLAKDSGAGFVYSSFGMTLRDRQRDYYYGFLDCHYNQLRGQYEKRYGGRYGCGVPDARLLYEVFAEECDRLGLHFTLPVINAAARQGRATQLSIFDFDV